MPFALGRPLGSPNQPEFQLRVLRRVLGLLTRTEGPVLEDFPEEAPDNTDTPQAVMPLVCPVSFGPDKSGLTPRQRLAADFDEEFCQMLTWYEIARQQKRSSSAGVSGRTPAEARDLILEFLDAKLSADDPVTLADSLRLAADEIKTVYFEAVAAQPGQPTDSLSLAEWFWGQTTAARVINEMRLICQESEADPLRLLGSLLLVPRSQLPKFSQAT